MTPPRATYRLQFHRDFTFNDANQLVDYLAALGISHLYASPFLKARPGSTHGYDIIDHTAFNPEIGTEADFRLLSDRLAAQGISLIFDFVPNHMGVGGKDNAWWLDVLEWGESSSYADYFDIDWRPIRHDLWGKVLLPVLGDQYGAVLERGDIALRFDPAEGSFSAWYYDHRFPISPRHYPTILRRAVLAGAAGERLRELTSAFAGLPAARTRQRRCTLHDDGARLKATLAEVARTTPDVADALGNAAEALRGTPGVAASWRPLHLLLEAQSYRLAYWRVAADEINYRRFFNINDLAGLRIELPELFERTHVLVQRLIAEGRLQGLRIDHIDGLFNPAEYCERLQRAASSVAKPPSVGHDSRFYITIEKILAFHEALRSWPIAGTTGYDFIAQVTGLFVDPEGEAPLGRIYRRFTGRSDDYAAVLHAGKRRILEVNLASEVNVLAQEFHSLAVSHWLSRDFTLNGMRAALAEVLALFPVYRTYVTEAGASAEDRRYIDWAVAQAKKSWPGADTSIFDFVRSVLTGDLAARGSGYARSRVWHLAMKFQQVSGPVMAKGAEDTAFYRYVRFLALNEVGGDPSRFGHSVAAFHHQMEARAKDWPTAMLVGTTHDTKRGEDARARLALLSEMPREWEARVVRWARFNRRWRGEIDGRPAPDRNDEYFFYQTVVGAWPLDLVETDADAMAGFTERVQGTMTKMVREAKEQSSWSNPNADYEAALGRFVSGALDGTRANPFLQDMRSFVDSVARRAAINSLAQTLLRLTVPGVPDIYQGAELWDLSMVDPDNRRPVAWEPRRRLLDEMRRRYANQAVDHDGFAELAASWRDGREKLFLTWRALSLRAAAPELFAAGDYLPIAADGIFGDHLCAFARKRDGQIAVTVVPRLIGRLTGAGGAIDWQDTTIALPDASRWRDVLAGTDLSASGAIEALALLRDFPVALLLAEA